MSASPKSEDDDVFDVTGVLFQAIPITCNQDPETSIKSRLRHEADQVTIGQSEEKIIYANAGGHSILDDMEEMKREIKILKAHAEKGASQHVEAASQLEEHRTQISALRTRVRSLAKSSEAYMAIRKRFLDVYKRDIKEMEGMQGSKGIREGNAAAYHGDAVADAILFERDNRTDHTIYQELYGLQVQQVLDFQAANEDEGLFHVLDAHATMVAAGKSLSDDLKAAFLSFLENVERFWLQSPSRDPNTSLGMAYFTFWKEHKKQAQA